MFLGKANQNNYKGKNNTNPPQQQFEYENQHLHTAPNQNYAPYEYKPNAYESVPIDFQNNASNNLGIDNKSLQRNFIRKVLGILSVQLLIMSIFVLIAVLSERYRQFMKNTVALLIIAIVVMLVTMISLYCFRNNLKKVPRNYILLFTFTISISYFVSYIAGAASPVTVMLAAAGTLGITILLMLYAIFTKKDITKYVAFAVWAPIALLFIIIFFGGGSSVNQLVISVLFILLYSFYLVFDIQRLTGRYSLKYSFDEYILAALDLFIDVVIIFLEILSILNR